MPTRLLDVATAQASLGAVRRSAWQRVRVARFIQIIVERAAAGGWHPSCSRGSRFLDDMKLIGPWSMPDMHIIMVRLPQRTRLSRR